MRPSVALLLAAVISLCTAGTAAAAAAVVPATAAPRQQQLADAWRLTPQQAAAIGRTSEAGKIRVCISPYTPQVYCDVSQPQHTYTGYQVELFRELAKRVTWLANPSAWFFDCMPWTPMIDDLLSANGTCLLAPSGIDFRQERLEKGMQLSWAIDQEGLKILTRPMQKQLNLWAPFTVFTAQLWALLFVTSILTGVLVWVVDTRACSLLQPLAQTQQRSRRGSRLALRRPSKGSGNGLCAKQTPVDVQCCGSPPSSSSSDDSAEDSALKPAGPLCWLLGVQQGEEARAMKQLRRSLTCCLLRVPDMSDTPAVKSLPAKLILCAYGLLVLVIAALYTANATAQLTVQSLRSDIRSIDDLRGKAVVTWAGYASKMQEQGLAAILMPWETDKDEAAMLNMLRSGKASALIAPASFVDWHVAQNCGELEGVGDAWSVMDTGIGYSRRMPRELHESMNTAIAVANEQGLREEKYNVYIRKSGSRCARRQGADTGPIGLEQVAGLWVLVGFAVAMALCVLGLYWLRRHHKNALELAAGIAVRAASRASATLQRVSTSAVVGGSAAVHQESPTPSQQAAHQHTEPLPATEENV